MEENIWQWPFLREETNMVEKNAQRKKTLNLLIHMGENLGQQPNGRVRKAVGEYFGISGVRAEAVIAKLGFDYSFRVEAVGFAGGIWLLWKGVLVWRSYRRTLILFTYEFGTEDVAGLSSIQRCMRAPNEV
ncbi:hypothetical protein J1N35_029661 [Gossypium stocksii]|uniref:Uncharacterized protein n=1 Tax=Gossypium stocksii TaxID=47602 RepID=A0A9D3ZTZ9_9ROSI|nr:hypothetical protein J1N35_029661 [Gossypium stocksii]